MTSTSGTQETQGQRMPELYGLDASCIKDSGRQLLREYSGISDEEINGHVETIRKNALEVRPYPCIGMFRFLDLFMMTTDIYQEVLTRVKNGEKFLDLGCCFGQEIRKLVFDGAPSQNTYGADLSEDLLSTGYELFKDKDRLQTTFMAADVFDDLSPLSKLVGQIDIIYTGAFFHLFNLGEQERVALRIVQLLAPKPGSLLVGQQTGADSSGEYSRSSDKSGRKNFRHNAQSWKELWDRIGEQTGSRWTVEATLYFPEFTLSVPEGELHTKQNMIFSKGLSFVVRRLS